MKALIRTLRFCVLGCIICFLGEKATAQESSPINAVYTYHLLPYDWNYNYQTRSKTIDGRNLFYYNRMAEKGPKKGDRFLSRHVWFWRGDTLFQVFDIKRGDVPFLTKTIGTDTLRNDLGFLTLVKEDSLLGGRKAFHYRIYNSEMNTTAHGYSIDTSAYLAVSYLEGVGFLYIGYINENQHPKGVWRLKLVKINGIPTKRYLRRNTDFQLILENGL